VVKARKASSKRPRAQRWRDAETSENLPDRIDVTNDERWQKLERERLKAQKAAEEQQQQERELREWQWRQLSPEERQRRAQMARAFLGYPPPKAKRQHPKRGRGRPKKYERAPIIKVVHDYLDAHGGKLPPVKPGGKPSMDGLIAAVCRLCENRKPPIAHPQETVMKDICESAEKAWRAGR
jgi:hypothetical protein